MITGWENMLVKVHGGIVRGFRQMAVLLLVVMLFKILVWHVNSGGDVYQDWYQGMERNRNHNKYLTNIITT